MPLSCRMDGEGLHLVYPAAYPLILVESAAHPGVVHGRRSFGLDLGRAPLNVLDWVIDDLDLILIMSVNPGFGGQSFIDSALRKLEQARKHIDACGKDIRLEIDGGVKPENIRRIADAGADTFVAGSAIFNAPSYADVIARMRQALA